MFSLQKCMGSWKGRKGKREKQSSPFGNLSYTLIRSIQAYHTKFLVGLSILTLRSYKYLIVYNRSIIKRWKWKYGCSLNKIIINNRSAPPQVNCLPYLVLPPFKLSHLSSSNSSMAHPQYHQCYSPKWQSSLSDLIWWAS